MSPTRLIPAAVLAAAVLCAPASASSAAAALPPAKPPTTAGLASAGLKVTWPLAAPATASTPGARFAVKVRRGSARATVSLVRVNGDGRALRTVARRTLRSGTFTAVLPAAAPARYALRLSARGRTFFGWIEVPAPAAPAPRPRPQLPPPVHGDPPPPNLPQPLPQWTSPCPSDDPAKTHAIMKFADGPPPQPVAPGTRVVSRVWNLGPTCLAQTSLKLLHETAPGTWEEVEQSPGAAATSPALEVVPPGRVIELPATVPSSAPAGTYKVTYDVVFLRSDYQLRQPITTLESETFTVATP